MGKSFASHPDGRWASPKSINFTCPVSFTRKFSGLISRWTQPLPCIHPSPSAACSTMVGIKEELFAVFLGSNSLLQIGGRKPLHGQERRAAVNVKIVNLNDPRMLDFQADFALLTQIADLLAVLGGFWQDRLDRQSSVAGHRHRPAKAGWL